MVGEVGKYSGSLSLGLVLVIVRVHAMVVIVVYYYMYPVVLVEHYVDFLLFFTFSIFFRNNLYLGRPCHVEKTAHALIITPS